MRLYELGLAMFLKNNCFLRFFRISAVVIYTVSFFNY